MIMLDNTSNALITKTDGLLPPVSLTKPAGARYSDVLAAVNLATDLTPKVKQNLRAAVSRASNLVSAQGLHGPVDITQLQKKLERQTSATLKFETDGALAAFKSNLRRALRLAGHDIMPGRHVTPLSPNWSNLMDQLGGARIAIKLSRFAHVATGQGWEPQDISPGHLERFREILNLTNLGSKTSKVVRGTIAAWSHGFRNCAGWPPIDLGAPPAETRFYALNWSAFPGGFREDVELYLSRPASDLANIFRTIEKTGAMPWLSNDGRDNGLLRDRTKENYRDALRRAASILVKVGHRNAEDITNLAAIIGVAETQKILSFLKAVMSAIWHSYCTSSPVIMYARRARRFRILNGSGKWSAAASEKCPLAASSGCANSMMK
jgi:hypothetical protein